MRRFVSLAFATTLALAAASAFGLTPDKDGWYHTGDGIRTKSIAFITVKVYGIGHDMKCLPSAKAKPVVIDTDCDKRLTWKMSRDVDKEKIHNALREAYKMNGFTDEARISKALGAFTVELKENSYVTITYNSATKQTAFWEQGGGTQVVDGLDFMKATWSIWFGKIDQPSLGDALISKL
jgi:hypothetical protein